MFKWILTPDDRILRDYDDYFRVMDLAIEVDTIVSQNLDERRLTLNDLTPFQRLTIVLFFKTRECLLSVATLSACGQTEDAKVVVRKLLESAVNLKYISLEPGTRVDRFLAHGTVKTYMLANRVMKDKAWSAEIQAEFQRAYPEIAKAFETHKSKFSDHEGKLRDEYRRFWSGKSIPKMAVECGLADDLSAYEVLNYSTHTSSADVATYFDHDSGHFRVGSNTENLPGILLESVRLYSVSMRVVVDDFKIDVTKSIGKLEAVLNHFGRKWVAEKASRKAPPLA